MPKIKMTKSYSEKDVTIYKGLDGIRAKPGMYIGDPSSYHGPNQCVKEVTDNVFDENLAGRNNFLGVAFKKNGEVVIWDHGGGVPVGKHKTTGKSTLIEVFGSLHAGAKMNAKDSAYAASTGTHGVGSKATNALSEYFIVTTCREGKWWSVAFKKGKLSQDLKKVKPPKTPNGKTAKRGTVVQFKLDFACFAANAAINIKKIVGSLEIASFLYPGIKIVVVNEFDGTTKTFYQPDGYKELLGIQSKKLGAEMFGKPFIMSSKNLNVVVQWSDYKEEAIKSYVNGSPTVEHGTHVKGFFSAINEALKPYRGKKAKFTPEDLRSGLLGVLNYKMAAPMFDSQTKEKLKTTEAEEDVKKQTLTALVAYFKGNKTFARELCSRAAEFNKLGAQFAASKKLASKLTSNKSRAMLPAKLATSTTKDPKKRELFVVEGDSAGGTAKKARDSYFQEILPLRGKIINAYGPSGARAFENNEVIALLQAIGYSPKNKHPEKHLRVGKIFIMADADPDGHHIALLVLSILYRVLPPLFVDKMVYMVNTPLFMASHRDKQFIGNTRKEVLDQAGSKAKGVIVTRFKGLGEISPDSGVLQAIAFNPKTRDVTLVDALAKSERPQFVALAGESPQQRKRLLFDEIRTTTGE